MKRSPAVSGRQVVMAMSSCSIPLAIGTAERVTVSTRGDRGIRNRSHGAMTVALVLPRW